jgi:phytoene dehydrogenase-like protein
VAVLESHDTPGGAAHSWERRGFHFESGPSLYSGVFYGRVPESSQEHFPNY